MHGDDIHEIKPKYRKTSVIRINEPLRNKLGVKVGNTLDFEIKKKPKGFLINWYYFVRYHPDDTVVVATWLGIIAVLTSIASIVFGLISLIKVFCN